MAKQLDYNTIDVIQSECVAVAQCFGVAAAHDLAAMLADRLSARLAGTSLYIGTSSHASRRERCAAIRARYTGGNAAELAREYGVTVRYVRKLVSA